MELGVIVNMRRTLRGFTPFLIRVTSLGCTTELISLRGVVPFEPFLIGDNGRISLKLIKTFLVELT